MRFRKFRSTLKKKVGGRVVTHTKCEKAKSRKNGTVTVEKMGQSKISTICYCYIFIILHLHLKLSKIIQKYKKSKKRNSHSRKNGTVEHCHHSLLLCFYYFASSPQIV